MPSKRARLWTKMEARAKDEWARKFTPWKLLVCIGVVVFAGYQLYQWFVIGRIYSRGVGGAHYISYAEHPVRFAFAALIYISAFLLFGCGSVMVLLQKFSRR
jgi:hypothetical protein